MRIVYKANDKGDYNYQFSLNAVQVYSMWEKTTRKLTWYKF